MSDVPLMTSLDPESDKFRPNPGWFSGFGSPKRTSDTKNQKKDYRASFINTKQC